jgi:hypothetical protein
MAQHLTPGNNALPSAERLDLLASLGSRGISDDPSDIVLPFWILLQHGSPETNLRSPECIQGAEAGCWLDRQTGNVYGGEDGIDVFATQFVFSISPFDAGMARGARLRGR